MLARATYKGVYLLLTVGHTRRYASESSFRITDSADIGLDPVTAGGNHDGCASFSEECFLRGPGPLQ